MAGPVSALGTTQVRLKIVSLFDQAQRLLVDMTGCTPRRAAHALVTTAAELHLSAQEVARRFVSCMHDETDVDAEAILVRLVAGSVAVDRLSSERAYQNPERGTEPSYVVRSRIGGIRGVAMGGELDVMSARHLVSVAADVGDTTGLTPDGRLPFFIDLENVTFIDSDGLRALGGICRQVSSRGEQLLVTTPTAAGVRRLLTFAVSRGWLPNAFAPHDCVSV